MIVPPAGTWHRHYNTGTEPCRFVAIHASTAVQREEGGIEQIDFEHEDPRMHEMYEASARRTAWPSPWTTERRRRP